MDGITMWLTQEKAVQIRKDDMETQIGDLQVQFKTEKKTGMIEINKKEFEKIQDVKKLTEEMDFKVKET